MEPLPSPDLAAEPDGFVVVVDPGDRIHFLDWGGPVEPGDGRRPRPGVLLIHGLSNTAWSWTPVARRLRAVRRVVAMDLRGHGLSDAPTEGYDPPTFAGDVLAAAEGSGLLAGPGDRVVLAGHGFGAIVAAWAAADLGDRCAGLVLVDGGWESLEAASGMDVDEFLRGLDEPPEVMRSMTAFLADRAAFDPATLGRRPGAGRARDGRRDARRQGRAVDPAARARGQRPGDVRVRPARDPRRGRGAGRRRWPRPTTRQGRGRRRWPRRPTARAAAGLGRDPVARRSATTATT